MDCSRAEEFVQTFFDGQLKAHLAIELGAHLAGCSRCKALFDQVSNLCSTVEEFPAPARTGAITGQVLRELRADLEPAPSHSRRPILIRWWPVWASAAAAAVLFFIFRNGPEDPEKGTRASLPEPRVQTQEVSILPSQSIPEPAASPAKDAFNAQEAVRGLYEQPQVNEEELARTQRCAQLFRELRLADKKADAAKELAELAQQDKSGKLAWQLASAVANRSVGADVFKAVASLKPELHLAPIYISALDQGPSRREATERLRTISGLRLGSQKELWLSWWAKIAQSNSAGVADNTNRVP